MILFNIMYVTAVAYPFLPQVIQGDTYESKHCFTTYQ